MSFCLDDVCVLKANTAYYGQVLGTSSDTTGLAELHDRGHSLFTIHGSITANQTNVFRTEQVPPNGTVVVKWRAQHVPQLIATSQIQLAARKFLIGDLVLKAGVDHQRGTVLRTRTLCSLQVPSIFKHKSLRQGIPAHCHMLRESQEYGKEYGRDLECVQDGPIVRNISLRDLKSPGSFVMGNPVMYNDWIGVVKEVVDEITVRLFNNTVVIMTTKADPIVLGACQNYNTYTLGDVITTVKADLRLGRWLFGAYDANVDPVGVVVGIRTIQIEVDWRSHKDDELDDTQLDHPLPDPLLGLDELESGALVRYDMQSHCDMTDDIENAFKSDPDITQERVQFRDPVKAREKYGAIEGGQHLFSNSRAANLGYDMNVFVICDEFSEVEVMWQDATITTESSLDLVFADLNNEELFPGDIVHTNRFKDISSPDWSSPKQVGMVNNVNAADCLVSVRWFADPDLKLSTQDDRIGEWSHKLGEFSDSTETVSTYDVGVPDGLDFGILEMVRITDSDSSQIGNHWFGHILQNHLDGTFTVRVGGINPPYDKRVHVDNLRICLDMDAAAQEQLNGDEDEDASMGDVSWPEEALDDYPGDSVSSDHAGRILMGDRPERIDYVMDIVDGIPGRYPSFADVDDSAAWSTDSEGSEGMELDGSGEEATANDPPAISPTPADQNTPAASNGDTAAILLDLQPVAYKLLEAEVPPSHHFMAQSSTLSVAALRKVMREHTILSSDSAIPPGIFVRSWEQQCNLFRVLILGPLDTPYSRCPFVFDILLPNSYPKDPPKLFFHHRPSADSAQTIRINPNLYEDGLVCLSLLNTWPGSPDEGWQPGKSTLLQVLISIQSLILVREPFYNEPGYSEKRGTAGIDAQNVAYSERALLQSRSFLLHALQSLRQGVESNSSFEGIEDVLRSIYTDGGGPRLLSTVVADDEGIIERSEAATVDSGRRRDGISSLSKGACVTLRKALDGLKSLVAAH